VLACAAHVYNFGFALDQAKFIEQRAEWPDGGFTLAEDGGDASCACWFGAPKVA
jgi:hypothetical protein